MNYPPKPKKVAYVVIHGRIPGIYEHWWQCKQQVDGFVGACFKGYERYESAVEVWETWENEGINLIKKKHTRTWSGKQNRKGKVETGDRLNRIRSYARELVKKFSGPDGTGSHSYTIQ